MTNSTRATETHFSRQAVSKKLDSKLDRNPGDIVQTERLPHAKEQCSSE